MLPETATLAWAALVAAVVSAFVSLAVEYFAKPYAEVRKERMLDQHRALWALQRELRSFNTQVERLCEVKSWENSPVLMQKISMRACAQARTVQERFAIAGGLLPRVVRATFVQLLGWIIFHLGSLSPLIPEEEFTPFRRGQVSLLARVSGQFEIPANYVLLMMPWRRLHRWGRQWRARQLLAELKKSPPRPFPPASSSQSWSDDSPSPSPS